MSSRSSTRRRRRCRRGKSQSSCRGAEECGPVAALWPECQPPKQPAFKARRRQRSVPRQHNACTTPSCRGCRTEKIQATQYRATISEKWLTGTTKVIGVEKIGHCAFDQHSTE